MSIDFSHLQPFTKSTKHMKRNIGRSLKSIRLGGLREQHVGQVLYKTAYGDITDPSELEHVNALDTEIFRRLSSVYNLLMKSSPFKDTIYKCHSVYRDTGGILLQDLLKFPRINKELIKLLFGNYTFSSSIRALVLNDLCQLVIDGKNDTVLEILGQMKTYSHNILSAAVLKDLESAQVHESSTVSMLELLANIIITQATMSGETLLGAAYLIRLDQAKIKIDDETLRLVINSLTVDDEILNSYHAYTILKLIDLYGLTILSPTEMSKKLSYLSQREQTVYFANILYNHITQRVSLKELSQEEQNQFTESFHSLIEINLNVGQFSRALDIWKQTFNKDKVNSKSLAIIRKLLQDLPDCDTIRAILKEVPSSVIHDDDVIDILLKMFGKESNLDTYNTLVKNLNPPLKRLTLSLLFQSFLYQSNENAAEKVLGIIFKSKNGLSSEDFNSIIIKLLDQGNFKQCMTMAKTTDVLVAKRAYVSIFRRILEDTSVEDGEKNDILKEITIKLLKFTPNDESRVLITVELIRYLSARISNRAARKYYIAIDGLVSQSSIFATDKGNKVFNFEQFRIPNSIKGVLALSPKGRIKCLNIIMNQAIVEEDTDTIIWSVDEMRILGCQVQDILETAISGPNGEYFKSILAPKVVQTCK